MRHVLPILCGLTLTVPALAVESDPCTRNREIVLDVATEYDCPEEEAEARAIQTPFGPQRELKGDQIPDPIIWPRTLRIVARGSRGIDTYLATLGLSEAELEALRAESAAQSTRDDACRSRFDQLLSTKASIGASAYRAEFGRVEAACRDADMAAVQELLAAMSPDGAARLRDWVNIWRGATTARVSVDRAASGGCVDGETTNLVWQIAGTHDSYGSPRVRVGWSRGTYVGEVSRSEELEEQLGVKSWG